MHLRPKRIDWVQLKWTASLKLDDSTSLRLWGKFVLFILVWFREESNLGQLIAKPTSYLWTNAHLVSKTSPVMLKRQNDWSGWTKFLLAWPRSHRIFRSTSFGKSSKIRKKSAKNKKSKYRSKNLSLQKRAKIAENFRSVGGCDFGFGNAKTNFGRLPSIVGGEVVVVLLLTPILLLL